MLNYMLDPLNIFEAYAYTMIKILKIYRQIFTCNSRKPGDYEALYSK